MEVKDIATEIMHHINCMGDGADIKEIYHIENDNENVSLPFI